MRSVRESPAASQRTQGIQAEGIKEKGIYGQ